MLKNIVKKVSFISSVSLAGAFTTPTYAIFDAQILVGSRDEDLGYTGLASKTVNGQSTKVAFHLDPIPLVPISFGLALATVDYDVSLAKNSLSELSGFHIIPEVTVWTPSIMGISVFAKLGYSLDATKGKTSSTVEGSTFASDVAYEGQTTHIVPGIKYSGMIPMLTFLLEYDLGMGDWKQKGYQLGSVQIADETKAANSSTISLGLQLGL